MNRGLVSRSKKIGMPPGTLVHIGQQKLDVQKISVLDYDESGVHEYEIEDVRGQCAGLKEKPAVTWIRVRGLHETEKVKALGECFGLHPLVVEDILNTDQRSKMEDYGDYLYIVFKMLYCGVDRREVTQEQISLVLGQTFVISFQEAENQVFEPVRERVLSGKGLLRKLGPDYLVYGLLDIVVDNYFSVLEKLGENIEVLADRVLDKPEPSTLREIQTSKREMLFVHRWIWPLRETVSMLGKRDSALVKESTIVYLRDVYDHTLQIMDTVDLYREMLSETLDLYMSTVSNKLNQVMTVLTIIATIFIPLTFLAGVYGMNFKNMPELEWRWGYPLFWLVMVVVTLIMLGAFKRKKWF
ncbi:MAG TPA: magnesium/cobalt transporter CorA [Syntrophorhabdales bacterium]|nr:magnesium/cobalt transporter CorA [Syntrophorhabdales bacterium]